MVFIGLPSRRRLSSASCVASAARIELRDGDTFVNRRPDLHTPCLPGAEDIQGIWDMRRTRRTTVAEVVARSDAPYLPRH